MSDKIPYGYCHCGCGQKTKIIQATNRAYGLVKREPYKFIRYHQMKRPWMHEKASLGSGGQGDEGGVTGAEE